MSAAAAMDYLPIFLRLQQRPVAVVGGGVVARRKVSTLRAAGAHVTVIAPHLDPQLAADVARGELRHIAAPFAPAHLGDAVLVIAATDDARVNRAVSQAARERNLPVNVVDDAELSTFIFPAIIDRSPILVAVSSAARAPVLARRIRAQIEAQLPARLGALAHFMGERRRSLQRALAAPARRRFWERIVSGPVATRLIAGDEAGAERAYVRELHGAQLSTAPAGENASAALGEVYLIGAGPGDPDLLTLRSLQLLQQADVVLYDRLVSPQILARARRDAEQIFVGKTPGECGQQERIHELLLRHALAGKRVARLKGGDPFVFGRGGEELEVLAAHDIPCTIVPGVTAALGAAASAALPLTHRRLAHSVTFVNGHQGASDPASDWAFFADPQHTVVFYMGLGHLPEIVGRLRAAGAAAEHPAALIACATLAGQQIVRGTLANIIPRVKTLEITPPALLIVGNVAAFSADLSAEIPGLGATGDARVAAPASIAVETAGALA
ncbi:MAG TPA: siroheme synthase CysG [Steroidobacteraceae bacterium]|nr:siroheme synthase CysG [Steroidobacteraceae bacterium]